MDEQTRKRERRLRQHFERLRSKLAACFVCGERSPHRLQGHHTAGRHHSETIGWLCLNHHADITDEQRDYPYKIFDPPDPVERIAYALLNEAFLFEVIAAERRQQGEWLLNYVLKSVPANPDPESEPT